MANEAEKQSDKSVDPGCPVLMGERGASRCGRKVGIIALGADEEPVCLMHTKGLFKQAGSFLADFWQEFERTLTAAGESEAHFEGFVFPRADFRGREFRADCHFGSCVFAGESLFSRATFKQGADFRNADFANDADFNGAAFAQGASFTMASFQRNALFGGTIFSDEGDFIAASFSGIAQFSGARFQESAIFSSAVFSQAAFFADAEFRGVANMNRCEFLEQAEFRRTRFVPQYEGQPSIYFSLASFAKPGEIIFDAVDLSRALFRNCDVGQALFTSSVRWGNRLRQGGLAIFEEMIGLEQDYAAGLKKDGRRDYASVAQIYQQLKKNYDARLDYWTANEFHFGEMEMKRLAGPTSGKLLGLRQWLHRSLSLVAFYRWFSDYGNSYLKPMLWLLAILLLTAAVLPIPGLKRENPRRTETYTSVWRTADRWTPNLWAEARVLGKSTITAVDTATFQKGAEYSPAYPWGRVIAILETLLTSTLFGLFLLAIRRQFKR